MQTARLAYEKAILEGKKCYVFAEDKITLSLELEIAKLCGGGFWDIDVITFKRYISSKVDLGLLLSKESSVMAIRKIISENEKQLNCLSVSASKPNLALTLYELISQLESAKVSSSDLQALIEKENSKVSGALLLKIKDVAYVYEKYENYLKDSNLYDGNDYLSLMPDLVKNDSEIKKSVVIIAGFPSVTMQRYDIFYALNSTAMETYASVIYDKNSEFYTGETYKRLLDIDKKATIIPFNEKLNSEVEFIKTSLYNPTTFSRDFKSLKTDKVSLYEASSSIEEVERVAKSIVYEVSKNNVRFRDISVILGDINGYAPHLKKYFKEYNIPYFLDDSTTLKEHPITLLICDYFNLVRKGLYKDDFIKFVSNGLFTTDKELSGGLASYILKYSLSRNGLKNPFTYQDDNLELYEQLREKVLKCYSFMEKATTVTDYVRAIKLTLEVIDAKNNAKILSEKLEQIGEYGILDFNEKAYDKMLEMLTETERVMGDVKMSILDFKSVILSGAVATVVGKIPLYNDAVYVGECKSVRIKSSKILYAVGLNGDIPFTKSDTSLLSDGDLKELDGFDIIVEPKISIVNKREKEDVCLALMSFNDKLKLSYSNLSPSGNAAFKSDVVSYLASAFALKAEKGDNKNLKYLAEKPSIRAIAELSSGYQQGLESARVEIASFYEGVDGISDGKLKDKADKLLTVNDKAKVLLKNPLETFNDGYISTTVLEKFFSCPYANYAQNVLRLQETEKGEMRANETGNILHFLVEFFVGRINEVTDKESSDKLVESLMTEILAKEDFARYLNNPMYQFNFSRLIKEGKRVCYALYESLQNSSFKPYKMEAEFNDKPTSEYKPIVLNTKKGDFKIVGKVDRIDKHQNNVRIVDYKTGEIKSEDEYFYTGNKLQLYLYMNAFLKEGENSAGVYYSPIHDGYDKTSERNYLMRGKTVSTDEIIKATDNTLQPQGKSEYVSVSLKKDGNVTATSQCLTQEEMDKYLKYAIKIAKKGVEEIASGFIEATPYKGGCTYCNYNGMCGYNEAQCDKTRQEKDVEPKTIVDAVDKEDITND